MYISFCILSMYLFRIAPIFLSLVGDSVARLNLPPRFRVFVTSAADRIVAMRIPRRWASSGRPTPPVWPEVIAPHAIHTQNPSQHRNSGMRTSGMRNQNIMTLIMLRYNLISSICMLSVYVVQFFTWRPVIFLEVIPLQLGGTRSSSATSDSAPQRQRR